MAARDWVYEQGGINLIFLAEHFGNAQIWATECTRYSTHPLQLAVHALMALAFLVACFTANICDRHYKNSSKRQ